MSTLTLRPWREADGAIGGVDLRGVKSPNTYTYVCEENGVAVGVAMGRASLPSSSKDTSPRTCYEDYTCSLLPNRLDIILALIERQAQNGVETGHTYALAKMPTTTNCTNLGTTVKVTGQLTTQAGLTWQDEGKIVATNKVALRRTAPILLSDLLTRLNSALNALGCVRVRKDA